MYRRRQYQMLGIVVSDVLGRGLREFQTALKHSQMRGALEEGRYDELLRRGFQDSPQIARNRRRVNQICRNLQDTVTSSRSQTSVPRSQLLLDQRLWRISDFPSDSLSSRCPES